MAQFPEIPVTVISNFELKFLSKYTILFQILQTKITIFGTTTNTTYWFSYKQYNLFYTVQKHEICPFMETVPFARPVLEPLVLLLWISGTWTASRVELPAFDQKSDALPIELSLTTFK